MTDVRLSIKGLLQPWRLTVRYLRYFHVASESDMLCTYLNAWTPSHLISLYKYWIRQREFPAFIG